MTRQSTQRSGYAPDFRRPPPAVPSMLWSRRGYKKNGRDLESSLSPPPPFLAAENLRIRPATSLAVTGRPRLASTWKGSRKHGEAR